MSNYIHSVDDIIYLSVMKQLCSKLVSLKQLTTYCRVYICGGEMQIIVYSPNTNKMWDQYQYHTGPLSWKQPI